MLDEETLNALLAEVKEDVLQTKRRLAFAKSGSLTPSRGFVLDRHTSIQEADSRLERLEIEQTVLEARRSPALLQTASQEHGRALESIRLWKVMSGSGLKEEEILYAGAMRHQRNALESFDRAWRLAKDAGFHLLESGHVSEARGWFGEAARVRETMMRVAQDKSLPEGPPLYFPDETSLCELFHLYALAGDAQQLFRVMSNVKQLWVESTPPMRDAVQDRYLNFLADDAIRRMERQPIMAMSLADLAKGLERQFSLSTHEDREYPPPSQQHQRQIQRIDLVPKYLN
jgi:hypothetical protein